MITSSSICELQLPLAGGIYGDCIVPADAQDFEHPRGPRPWESTGLGVMQPDKLQE